MRRLVLICYCCWVCGVCAQIFDETDYPDDYPFYPPDAEPEAGNAPFIRPEVVRKQSGIDILLKCHESCPHQNNGRQIVWQFKPCHPDFKRVPCSKFYQSTDQAWQPANEGVHSKKCWSSITLKNTDESQSGLYKCVEETGKVVKVYEVEVVDFSNKYNYSGDPPQVLDVAPSNLTLSPHSQAKIQCRVYSKRVPVIWWFKQSDGTTDYDIKYRNKFYSRINSSLQVYPVPDQSNVYLSKMAIFSARNQDSGLYVCVAMTESGKDFKNVLVTVSEDPATDLYYYCDYLLFLIPVTFALIPISLWCCFRRRWEKPDSIPYKFQEKICTTHV